MGYHHVRDGGVTFVPRFGSALNLNPHLPILFSRQGVQDLRPDPLTTPRAYPKAVECLTTDRKVLPRSSHANTFAVY